MNISRHLRRLNARFFPRYVLGGPEWIVLSVNSQCNLHCRMCDIGTNNSESVFSKNLFESDVAEMPPELFKKICDQAKEYYPNVKLGYAFTEPLMYSFLGESLEYAAKNSLYTSITTNGLLLKQKAAEIIEGKCSDIFLSLDGPEIIHNRTRGHGQSFANAMAGVETLLAKKQGPRVSVFCVITRWNFEVLKTFADFFRSFPITHLGFLHQNFITEEMADVHNHVFGNAYPATSSCIGEGGHENIDIDLLWIEIQSIKKVCYPFNISFSPEIKSIEQLEVYYKYPLQKIGTLCMNAFNSLMIKPDGRTMPAHARCFNLNAGSLYKMELKDIWNSVSLSHFRKELIRAGGMFPSCYRCCSSLG